MYQSYVRAYCSLFYSLIVFCMHCVCQYLINEHTTITIFYTNTQWTSMQCRRSQTFWTATVYTDCLLMTRCVSNSHKNVQKCIDLNDGRIGESTGLERPCPNLRPHFSAKIRFYDELVNSCANAKSVQLTPVIGSRSALTMWPPNSGRGSTSGSSGDGRDDELMTSFVQ